MQEMVSIFIYLLSYKQSFFEPVISKWMTKYYYANPAICIGRVWLAAQSVVLDLVIGSALIVKGVCVHHA